VDKHSNPAVAAGHSVNAANWRRVSALVLDRFAGRFARVEPRRAAGEFVTGLLADLEIKTSWQLAEHAGHDRPDAMQRLLYRAKWDADAVRDDVRQVVIDRLGDPDGVLVVDETGDLKRVSTASVSSVNTPAPPDGSRTPRSASSSPTQAGTDTP
jgi:SRSO17 transposase